MIKAALFFYSKIKILTILFCSIAVLDHQNLGVSADADVMPHACLDVVDLSGLHLHALALLSNEKLCPTVQKNKDLVCQQMAFQIGGILKAVGVVEERHAPRAKGMGTVIALAIIFLDLKPQGDVIYVIFHVHTSTQFTRLASIETDLPKIDRVIGSSERFQIANILPPSSDVYSWQVTQAGRSRSVLQTNLP